jgi:succinoglycan biosynthesis transport protein ExoP
MPTNEEQELVTHDRPAWTARFHSRFQRYLNLMRTRWWILLICIALALGAEATYNAYAPPQFVSVGQMIVSIKLNIQQGSFYTEELNNFLGTQVELMKGSEVVNRARQRVTADSHLPPPPVALQVTVLPRTTIFVLVASSPSADYTKKFLQAVMEEYINLKKEMVQHTSDTTIAGLTDQMLRLQPEMQKNDIELQEFLSTNDVTLLEKENGAGNYITILYQQLASAQSEYGLLESMTLDQNLLLEQERSPMMAGAPMQNSMASSGGLLVNAGLAEQSGLFAPNTIGMEYLTIKQQILLLKADEERDSQYLKPMHPQMVVFSDEIKRLGQMLDIYRDQSVEQMDAKKSALDLQIKNLEVQTKEWGKENLDLSRKRAQYERLKAKEDRLQSLYDQLLATMETLDVNKDMGPESVTIYEPASDASPEKNLLKKGLLIAGLVGLAFGILILFVLDRMDDRMNTFTELQELFDEEVLGQIPREPKPARGGILPFVQSNDERHPFVEAYRNLRSSLLYMREIGARPHTLLITSSVPNDGKSVTAANLAIMLAQGGSRVLLVDADMRKGTLHSRFNIKSDAGLSEFFTQELDWHSLLKETGVPNLWLLPRGATTKLSSDYFIGPRMENFLKDSIKEYDYVLIDTAPVMAADDVTSLAPRVDGVIFVVRAEFTSARVARAALEMLYQRKARVLGLVFNSVRASSRDYYYYGRYHQYYQS